MVLPLTALQIRTFFDWPGSHLKVKQPVFKIVETIVSEWDSKQFWGVDAGLGIGNLDSGSLQRSQNMSSFFSAYFVITVVSNHFSDYRYGYLFTGIIETYHRYWVQYLFLSLQYRYSLMVANLNFLAEKQYFNHENSLIDIRLLLLSPRSVPCLPCHSQNSYFCVIAALTLR